MRTFSHSRRARNAIVVIALSASTAGLAAVPSVASAKALTKGQVIKLIKKYSKPGPAGSTGLTGPKGDPGPAGAPGAPGPAWTLGANSGLLLTNNALSVDPSAFQERVAGDCGGSFGLMTGIAQNGTPSCNFGTLANSLISTTQIAVGTGNGNVNSGTTVASAEEGGSTAHPIKYLMLGQVSLTNSSANGVFVSCSINDGAHNSTGASYVSIPAHSTASLSVQAWQISSADQLDTLVCAASTTGAVVANATNTGATSDLTTIALSSLSELGSS
jgi:hypothetical protein